MLGIVAGILSTAAASAETQGSLTQSRYLDLKYLGAFFYILPAKGPGNLRLQLIVQRPGIVIIVYDERFAMIQPVEPLENRRMLFSRFDFGYVQNFDFVLFAHFQPRFFLFHSHPGFLHQVL